MGSIFQFFQFFFLSYRASFLPSFYGAVSGGRGRGPRRRAGLACGLSI